MILRPNKSKNIEVTTSNHTAPAKKRLSTVLIDPVKESISHQSRSRSAHTDRKQVAHHHYHSPSVASHHWNVTTYYPKDYYKSAEPTKYITEIYDKATNRYIPTNC